MSAPSEPQVTPPRPRRRFKSLFTIWALVLGVCLAVLVTTYLLFVEAPPPRRLVIATGGRAGAYYHFARKYADELRKEGLTLEVRETDGSVENLQLLRDAQSGVDIALVQSGVAGPDDGEHLRALGSVCREPLWVFYRGPKSLDRLSQFAGKRIGVGPLGSGTHAIAVQMLAANGLTGGAGTGEGPRTVLVNDAVTASARALQKGELDAAFFVAAFEADYVRDLLHDDRVRLLSFKQHEAYRRRFRFLSDVTVPAGLVNLGENLPRQDIALLAPTAMLVVRSDFHPALVPPLLAAATRVHGAGDDLSSPGEFPSASYTDLPVSEDAQRYYKSGPPVLQRLLPFWLASLVDRLKIMLIPLVVLLMPLARATPPLVRWRTRRKIYLWYSVLREIDARRAAGLSGLDLDLELARLHAIEQKLNLVHVPLSYMVEFYHLRLHLKMVRENLEELRARRAEPAGPV
ncbi:MAG TPA: TAXI family TRAP transporter solute-binding subunit [Gemmataceae bacterium]|nr:TAXI family TRAP transporter solute-binding subunit [Gemmataceae bacterium]